MGGTVADLMITLGDSINAYNSLGKGKIQANLTADVVVVEETPSGTYIGPAGIVKLEGEFEFRPKFTLLHVDTNLHGAPDGAILNATLTGSAKYQDTRQNVTLQFTFEAAFTDRWRFQKVSARTVQPE